MMTARRPMATVRMMTLRLADDRARFGHRLGASPSLVTLTLGFGQRPSMRWCLLRGSTRRSRGTPDGLLPVRARRSRMVMDGDRRCAMPFEVFTFLLRGDGSCWC